MNKIIQLSLCLLLPIIGFSQDFTTTTLLELSLYNTVLADLNGDGTKDIIGNYASSNTVRFAYYQNDPATYNFTESVLFTTPNDGPVGLTLLDMNEDGLDDLITYEKDGLIQLRMNTSTTDLISFGEPTIVYQEPLVEDDFHVLMTAHEAEDGNGFFIIGINGGLRIFIESEDEIIYIGPLSSNLLEEGSYESRFIEIADFNGDGFLDYGYGRDAGFFDPKLIVGSLTIEGAFETITISELRDLRDANVVDFDNDGDLDIVAINDSSLDPVYLYTNDGSASFTEEEVLSSRDYDGMYAVDITGDGLADVITSVNSSDGGSTTAHINDGSGSYTEVEVFSSSPRNIRPIDYNEDGRVDLILSLGFGSRTVLATNNLVSSTNDPSVADIQLFPNPTTNGLVYLSEPAESLNIYDLQGRLVRTEMNIKELLFEEPGVYFLRGSTLSGLTFSKRVVVK